MRVKPQLDPNASTVQVLPEQREGYGDISLPVTFMVAITPLVGRSISMSLGTSLSLSKDSATDVDTGLAVYDLRAADMGRSEFSVAGLTLPAEQLLTVSHEAGKAGEGRHLVRLDRTVLDANLVPATVSVYIVIVRPPSTAVTNAVVIEEVNRLVDFLIEGGANANVVKLLNGEV